MEMSMSHDILTSIFSDILVIGRHGSVSYNFISYFSCYQPPIYLYDELGVFCGKLYLASFLCYAEGTNGRINRKGFDLNEQESQKLRGRIAPSLQRTLLWWLSNLAIKLDTLKSLRCQTIHSWLLSFFAPVLLKFRFLGLSVKYVLVPQTIAVNNPNTSGSF